MTPLNVSLQTIAATEQLANRLAPHLRRMDVVALQGSLGAGKTTFARALLRVLGVLGNVPSPTFTLLQTYDTATFPVYHFDLYRLKSAEELEEIGWDDACADGVVIVEWPERAESRMPQDFLMLHFIMDEKNNRTCVLKPHGLWSQRMKDLE